jgi:uncharacterized protein YegP (UPF0339 family)
MSFVIRKGNTGCQFDLLAANGQSIATSEVYSSEKACLRGVESVRENAQAPVEDLTAGETGLPNPKFQLYLDKRSRYRFRLKARNGRIIAASQSYRTKESCLEGIASLRENV